VCIITSKLPSIVSPPLVFLGYRLCVTEYESIVTSSAKIASLPEVFDLKTLYPELTAFL
jgi:hypothetical protein